MGTSNDEPVVDWDDDDAEALLDYTAAALAGLLANPSARGSESVAEEAADIADAVLDIVDDDSFAVPDDDMGALDVLLRAALSGVCASPAHWGETPEALAKLVVSEAREALDQVINKLASEEEEEAPPPPARRPAVRPATPRRSRRG